MEEKVIGYRKMELSKKLAEREVAFLREQLKTYDLEEANMMDQGNYDTQKTQRLSQMDAMMKEMKTNIENLEESLAQKELELSRQGATASSTSPDQEATLQQISVLEEGTYVVECIGLNVIDLLNKKKEIRHMEKELKAADQQIAILEKAVGQGHYDQESLRVLELQENPASLAFANRDHILRTLKEENIELRERVKFLLSSSSSQRNANAMTVDEVMPTGSYQALESENEELKKQSHDLEKKMMRLKEVCECTCYRSHSVRFSK